MKGRGSVVTLRARLTSSLGEAFDILDSPSPCFLSDLLVENPEVAAKLFDLKDHFNFFGASLDGRILARPAVDHGVTLSLFT